MKDGTGKEAWTLDILKSPFVYFGGKARVAPLVWERLGDCRNYCEPFFGSGAVLLARPTPFDGPETINDVDGLVANFWRAIQADPAAVADHADRPVNENDMHAYHSWLVNLKESLAPQLEGDPDWYDAKVAGIWAWGMACWIGSGFCSGKGPWQVVEVEGVRQLVHLGNAGQGVNRKRVHLGNAGQGVNRKRDDHHAALFAYFATLAARLRHVRVCCGDWSRVMGDTPMLAQHPCFTPVGVFLDPPYADTAKRDATLYRCDSLSVAHAVREWAIAHGDDPRYRIVLCGYDGEHEMPVSWACVEGKSGGGNGYGGQAKNGYRNRDRERLWFSPHCLDPETDRMPLFSRIEASTALIEFP